MCCDANIILLKMYTLLMNIYLPVIMQVNQLCGTMVFDIEGVKFEKQKSQH